MFLVAVALAGTNLGWPCSRMNWAWRNVWSTCSINSYLGGAIANAANDVIPAHFRSAPLNTGPGSAFSAPSTNLNAHGVSQPLATGDAVPNMLCQAMAVTRGVGTEVQHQLLRSRCRRAIDAYAGIVNVCRTPSLGGNRGPIAQGIYPDWAPATTQLPHSENVNNLLAHAQHCFASTNAALVRSPSTTCPGLLGWFTVVWNACGFKSRGPNLLAPAGTLPENREPFIAPLGETIAPQIFLVHTATTGLSPLGSEAATPAFIFCSPHTGATGADAPYAWNARGTAFRTTRCRKALDQFGRTAARCGGTQLPSTSYAAGMTYHGMKDALRAMAVGSIAGNVPMGLVNLAPFCNQ